MAETKELHEELNDQGNLVRDKIATIVKGAQATDRDLTDEEETLLRTHEAKLESIERQVELAQKAVHREAAHVQGMAPCDPLDHPDRGPGSPDRRGGERLQPTQCQQAPGRGRQELPGRCRPGP